MGLKAASLTGGGLSKGPGKALDRGDGGRKEGWKTGDDGGACWTRPRHSRCSGEGGTSQDAEPAGAKVTLGRGTRSAGQARRKGDNRKQ